MMLQVKALDTIVQGVLHKHSQAAFRVVTFRMETHLDERPTVTNVEQYLELLTAEMDYISHNGGPSQQLKVLQAHHHEVENDHVSFGVLRMAANMVQTAHMLTANCPKMELSGGGIVLDKVIGNPIA